MKTLLYLAAMAGLFTLPQCTINKPVAPSDLTSIGYFPDKVGYQWVYKVTDSLKNVTDTVTVSITGTINDSKTGETFKVWQYKWPDKIDTTYEERKGDTVKFYLDVSLVSNGCFPVVKLGFTSNDLAEVNFFVFPLSPNQKVFQAGYTFFSSWVDPNLSPFTYVNFSNSIVVDTSFDVYTGSTIPNTLCRVHTLFAPQIGIIKQTIETGWKSDTKAKYQYWELLNNNFSLKTTQ